MKFENGTVSVIKIENENFVKDLIWKFSETHKIEIIRSSFSCFLKNDNRPAYLISTKGMYLAALRSLSPESNILVVLLDYSLLPYISTRATRVCCLLGKKALVVLSLDGTTWYDDVESKGILSKEGEFTEESLYHKLF